MLLLENGQTTHELRMTTPVHASVAEQIPDRWPGKTPQPRPSTILPTDI
jgi:hypothetical protein